MSTWYDIMIEIEQQLNELKLLAGCANIGLDEVFNNDISMKEVKKKLEDIIIENHINQIFYSKSDGTWRTYIPDENSKSKRKLLKRKSKENLEKALVEFYKEKQRQECRDNLTLEDLYKEWLIYRRDYTSVKPKTIQENVAEWNKFFKGTDLAKMPLKDIEPLTLIRFFRKITKNRDVTHKRISNARSVLNGIMFYAIEEGLITHNPVTDVNFKQFVYKPVENQSDNVFSKQDTETLLLHLSHVNEPYSLAIQLSFYLFIRVGETKAIRWEDIDYENRTVYLHGQVLTERILNDDLTFSKRKVTLSNQMKGNTSKGFRKQYLCEQAMEILARAKYLILMAHLYSSQTDVL